MALGSFIGLYLLVSTAAMAQSERRRPVRAGEQTHKTDVPANEAQAKPVPSKKLEEALQLLFRADSARGRVAPRPMGPEEEGFVIDQTITKVGHDFYDAFYTRWESPPGINGYAIALVERPGRGTTTLIALVIDDAELFEMPLQPKYDLIEEGATEAVGMAQDYLREAHDVSRQLEKEDRGVSGRY
ncbi:CsgE family curli-type amyloid fiber assembly protein [Hymenobacter sp. CRA2]|uniref:CsgE family curli-type amyloid fiber assembly protein n=1 Tax=Hymenobacter sp. CRA2 TaxID=1955620 RepID=UPI0009C8F86D|nr:CsgE family curli-type amyloid fiber assembly protein [Hymenobacter sp. CRA2]OON68608.1 hypothetical protein B0919_13290 [Hymenobacter sp. CRA2]